MQFEQMQIIDWIAQLDLNLTMAKLLLVSIPVLLPYYKMSFRMQTL